MFMTSKIGQNAVISTARAFRIAVRCGRFQIPRIAFLEFILNLVLMHFLSVSPLEALVNLISCSNSALVFKTTGKIKIRTHVDRIFAYPRDFTTCTYRNFVLFKDFALECHRLISN